MSPRLDVSSVPLQGGYIAKQCPVRIQNDMLYPAPPVSHTLDAQMRIDDGNAFEASVLVELQAAAGPTWVFIDGDVDRASAVEVTVAAMEAGAGLIFGGWLPADVAGRRTGKPDLLIRAGDGYIPIDVKHHLTMDVDDDGQVTVSPVPDPFTVEVRTGWARRKHRGDVLQLAHYRRMLEACGHASSSMKAGIIGKERVVVWYDLDDRIWQTPAKSDGKKRKLRTSMEIYDFEFGFRLDIAATAQQAQASSGVGLLVEPVYSSECPECPWLDQCNLVLLAGSGDVSLLPGIGYAQWRIFQDLGIKDRAGVAALSYRTACLLNSKAPPEGMVDLDPATAVFGAASFLPAAILNARAAVGELPVYRLPGRTGTGVPRADIELDVDMESTNEGVYLWGVLITDRANTGLVEPGYLPFISLEAVDPTVEAEVFNSFWRWMKDLRTRAGAAGVSVNAYCWYAGAENTMMRRIAAADPVLAAEVAAFIASPQWIDMNQVFKESWITGGSYGLKTVAPLAGHNWSVDDPGGGVSMVMHLQAGNGTLPDEAREEATQWLLDYNRGDVEATLRIREWLDQEGSSWPEVAAN